MKKKTKELNRINNSLDREINVENREAFTDMICYLRGGNISEYNQEVVRQDLMEMVISAQERGENIRSVIGEDYKAFCDNVIASLPPKTMKQKGIDFIDYVCWSLSVLGIIGIIMADETVLLIRNLITGKPLDNYAISISLGSVISAGIIMIAASVLVQIIMKNSFQIGKEKQKDRRKAFLIGGGSMAVFLFLAWLGRTTLFTVNIIVALVVVLVLYIIHKVLLMWWGL